MYKRSRSSLSSSAAAAAAASSTLAMMSPKRPTLGYLKKLLLCLSLLFVLFLLLQSRIPPPLSAAISSAAASLSTSTAATTRRHLFFSIASSAASWPKRKPYVRLWYSPASTRARVFLDSAAGDSENDESLPAEVVSADTTQFPYTLQGGMRSAVRVARVVKEAVELVGADRGVRWFVFGDDDTVFFVENLARVLGKYDPERWFYVGSNSESFFQDTMNSFSMAFGGAGFALSASLARALARVFDSCLMRYPHLYGSDLRVYSCVAELGVGLTMEPGFHQIDFRGNLLGFLSAHPLSPLLSFHHLDAADPIFPDLNKTEAMQHLFEATNVDPARIMQQTVCYNSSRWLSVSIAWGYAIQVFEGNQLLPGLLAVQKTFTPWRKGNNIAMKQYMFDTRDVPKDICKRPAVFYMQSVVSNSGVVRSNYDLYDPKNCPRGGSLKNLKHISVFAKKLEPSIEETKAMRRQCCDISPDYDESMVVNLRKCHDDELISYEQ